ERDIDKAGQQSKMKRRKNDSGLSVRQEKARQLTVSLGSLLTSLRHALSDDPGETVWSIGPNHRERWRLVLKSPRNQPDRVRIVKRNTAGQQEEQRCANRIDVRSNVKVFSLQLFRRTVRRGSHDDASGCQSREVLGL